jgi:putative ABC transport system permease protein
MTRAPDVPDIGRRASNGGLPARRAVVRWAWRLFRREWRQQLLVLALLTVSVAAAVVAVSASYNVAPAQQARFGTAQHLLKYSETGQRTLDTKIAAAREWFSTADVIEHRFVPIPGSVETAELRAQDPNGPYGGPMLRLRDGHYPAGADQIAVTDSLATIFRLGIGKPLTLAGHTWNVVGLVENPGDLGDEFILVPPAHADPPDTATVLVNATAERFEGFRDAHGSPQMFESRGVSEQTAAATGVFGFVTIAMLLICLVAAAAFAVLAQRRLRQLGLLASIGATDRHVRLVLLASGAVVGTIAAGLGAVVGIALWIAIAPQLETAAQHRIDRFALPWWLIAAALLLAVGTATAAAWRPARAAARIPIMLALSGRAPRPKPARRSAILAVLLTGIGIGCLALAKQNNPPLIIAGTLATALGILFTSPLAIRALGAAGARLPLASRLALRDLARHQARSGAALAAISLALAVPVAVVIIASAAQHTAAEGNLSDRQLMIRLGAPNDPLIPDRSPAQLAALEAELRRFTATLDDPTTTALDMAVDANARPERGFDGSAGGRPAVELGKPISANQFRSLPLYVATADLLRHHGIDPDAINSSKDVLTTRSETDLQFVNTKVRQASVTTSTFDGPGYSSLPDSMITPATLTRNGWTAARAGWLVEAGQPLTTEQRAAARDLSVDNGLTVESRDDQVSLLVLRSGATAAGALLALGVLAMTVGLIRGEATNDLRTLTATGATGRIRRGLTAATAGGLALLGAILGIAGAYLALTAAYANNLGALGNVPLLDLTVTALGVPLVAATAGWLLAGKEPRSLTRPRLE